MTDPAMANEPRLPSDGAGLAEAAPHVPISRRQVLKLGAAAVPCLLGSTALFDWMTGLATEPSAPVDPIVAAYDPTAHAWGFVVDASSCIGCGQCVVACKQENGVPLDAEHTRTWVERHAVAPDGSVAVDSPEAGIHGFLSESAAADVTGGIARTTQFVPRLCMQCENSPCTVVCPVGATFRTPDGVILVDEQRCIGCGYCVVACPYGARYIVPAGPRTPTGVAGVADKCTFCYHRITRGQAPACVEICPVGARKFGDLTDPASEVSTILREQPTRVLRAELGTKPRVHYLGLEGEGI
jgi:tetrathionate reductase subunit B